MSISLRQLKVFVTVSREGNVTRAAEKLRVSQSAVSMSLSELERLLGEQLFDRRGKRLVLNDQGRALVSRAAAVLEQVDEISCFFSDAAGQLTGALRVGASSTIGNYLMPRILGAFRAKHPEARVSLDVGNTEQIVRELLHFNIDIGFIEGYCHQPALETIPWRQDLLAIHAGANHPLADRKSVSLKELRDAEWILREQGSGTREIFETALAGKIDSLRVALELGNTEAIKEAVETGLGISCLSLLATRRARQSGALVALKTPSLDLRRNFYMLLHGEKYRTRLLRHFMEFCKGYAENTENTS